MRRMKPSWRLGCGEKTGMIRAGIQGRDKSGKRQIIFTMSLSKIAIFWMCLVFLIVIISPVQAGTLYQEGTPVLSAYISGSNQANPGDKLNISIVVENTGLNPIKIVQGGVATREDPPTTAKFLSVNLRNGGAPLAVESDAQVIGDLPGGSASPSTFHIKINRDAPAGDERRVVGRTGDPERGPRWVG